MTDNTDERGEDYVARSRGGSEPGHLPECGWSEPCQPMHGGNPYANHYAGTIGGQTPDTPYCSNCAVWCICDRLRACEARLYTLMGAAIQSGIEAEQKRIRLAIAALVDGDVIDLSLSEYRAVVNAINEEKS